MRLGIDFDNTLVEYDRVFHSAAISEGLIPEDLTANKTIVRDHIRTEHGSDAWTELQGAVYGKHIQNAAPFEDAKEAIAICRARGVSVVLISHKTRWPVKGPPWNLHEAARTWLRANGFFDGTQRDNLLDEVWFEETREGKFERIASTGCDLFLDDLPEFLADAEFPKSCRAVLFDPMEIHAESARDLLRITSWRGILDLIDRSETAP